MYANSFAHKNKLNKKQLRLLSFGHVTQRLFTFSLVLIL